MNWGVKYVYLICTVRMTNGEILPEVARYVESLESYGVKVHYPPRDVDQTDPTGFNICLAHREAMKQCDEVHVFWNPESKGSHFDLGMAFMLGKPVKVVHMYEPDVEGKSYVKVMERMVGVY